tara:strand:- start:422 stop:538 length:117 start_codon:yes stop_codon:yes gene_type:complete
VDLVLTRQIALSREVAVVVQVVQVAMLLLLKPDLVMVE